jgi:IS605 OrfB family transposase
MFKTYQTKIKNEVIVLKNDGSIPVYEFFHENAKTFGMLERKLFVDLYVHHKPSNDLKVYYCSKYQITARQYNSIKKQLDGRVSSKVELTKLCIDELKDKIKHTSKLIESKIIQKEKAHKTLLCMKGNEKHFLKKVNSYRRMRTYIHQKKRKLHSLNLKLTKLVDDQQNKIVRLCFGSKELFHKQFHLKENNLSLLEWKKEWQEKRAAQFTFIGSKDETFGNQTCTYDEKNHLRIRVFSKDEEFFGNYVTLSDVHFPYGQENIDKAKIPKLGFTKGKKNETKYYRALTWKFVRKNNNWYANVTVDVDTPDIVSLENNGAVGIDFNAGFLAVTDVDRFGNYLHSFQVPFVSQHASSKQIEQSLSSALKVVVAYAVEKQKPIANENLDFKKKKQNLKQLNPKQAKLLSGFAYSSYQSMLKSKCETSGIKQLSINPAYTSQIGHHKFMKKYGLSSHESAALVIARRSLSFNKIEKVPQQHLSEKSRMKFFKKDRLNQWKEIVKEWKKYSLQQKLYLLNKM